MPGTFLPVEYLPVFLMSGLAIGFGVINIIIGSMIRPSNPYKAKLDPYECGVDPVGNAHDRFSVRFYIIAMLFLLFDVEAIFLYPWAIVSGAIGKGYWFTEMFLFIVILLVGYIYAWKKGALEWE